MSGIVKGIGKVFKKIGKVLKKIIKPLAIAVAVYFTAGLALAAFPATAGFAASMPGFAGGGFLGTGIGVGATAGTGVFSNVATAIGLGGGLQAGAAGLATPAAAGAVTSMPSVFNSAAANAAMTGGAATGASAAASTAVGMSLTDKLLLTKIGTDVAGALFGPSPQEEWEAQAIEKAKFRGAFYGMEADGSTAAAPPAPGPEEPGPEAPPPSPTVTPEQQQLLAGRERKESLFPSAKSMPQPGKTTGPGEMQQQFPVPSNVAAPAAGVRYI